MLSALVLLAACAGETTSPEVPTDPTPPSAPSDPILGFAPAGFRVLPGKLTLEVNQPVRFRGELRTHAGQVLAPQISWQATGGAIDTVGNFSAGSPGTYRIIGWSRAHPERGQVQVRRPDTSVVVVVPRRPGLVDIRVSPRSASLEPGAVQTFSAMGRLRSGNRTPIGVVWSATGGNIDPAGTYQAGSVPGSYIVVATNTEGDVADTVTVRVTVPVSDSIPTPSDSTAQPLPEPTPEPEPAPTLARVVLRPASVTLATQSTHQFAAFGRNTVGDSVEVAATFRATGGTITPTGLYTAGQTAGTFKVIAAVDELADTAVVTLSATSGGGTPEPTPTQGVGIPLGLSGLLAAGIDPSPYNMSLDGYTAQSVVTRLQEARARKLHVLMNMTGGAHNNYKTDGVFDMAKWRARMDTYNTPAIRTAVAAAVADGTIIGNSVMDEPFVAAPQVSEAKSWGPPGTMTKVRVDEMCGYVKAIFPTMPVGVVHDHDDFEPSKSYRTCDFIVSQYRWGKTKGDVKAFRDAGLALARRDGHAIAFSLNILHGGIPGTDCAKYGDDNVSGTLCPMTPQQVQEYGQVLGQAGCALNMWRYEREYFIRPDIQRAVQAIAGTLAQLPRKPCLRS
jgi:hypothetical protein